MGGVDLNQFLEDVARQRLIGRRGQWPGLSRKGADCQAEQQRSAS